MKEDNKPELEYDEEKAVKFIMNNLPQEMKSKVEAETIEYVLDVLYEYYESKGIFEDDPEKEVEIDEDEMIAYVAKVVKKEKFATLSIDEITFIVQGEIAYCDSIGLFEE